MAHATENMKAALETFRQRNAVYGDNYLKFGPIMVALFPDGLSLKTEMDFNRFGILFPILTKLTRYLNNPNIGHEDSIHDIGVYAFMLEQLDADHRAQQVIKNSECEFARVCDVAERIVNEYLSCEHVYDEFMVCKACGFGKKVASHQHIYKEGYCELCGVAYNGPFDPNGLSGTQGGILRHWVPTTKDGLLPANPKIISCDGHVYEDAICTKCGTEYSAQ